MSYSNPTNLADSSLFIINCDISSYMRIFIIKKNLSKNNLINRSRDRVAII